MDGETEICVTICNRDGRPEFVHSDYVFLDDYVIHTCVIQMTEVLQ